MGFPMFLGLANGFPTVFGCFWIQQTDALRALSPMKRLASLAVGLTQLVAAAPDEGVAWSQTFVDQNIFLSLKGGFKKSREKYHDQINFDICIGFSPFCYISQGCCRLCFTQSII